MDSYFETVKEIKTVVNEKLLDTNPKKQCDSDPYGIYHNDLCHFYMALKRLCIKIKFEMND